MSGRFLETDGLPPGLQLRGALAQGDTLAGATLRAKQAARAKSDDLTWLAYCVYSDPATTFKLDPEPPST